MNKLKRKFLKDKYGVVRSCTVMCVLLVLCAVTILYVSGVNRDYNLAGSAASTAAQVRDKLDQMIDGHSTALDSLADRIDAGEISFEHALHLLDTNDDIASSSIDAADGILAAAVIAPEGHSIQLRSPLATGQELTATLTCEALESVLSNALDASYTFKLYNLYTGVCLQCSSQCDDVDYYDTLLAYAEHNHMVELPIGADDSVHVMRMRNDEGKIYIASAECSTISCGISLELPASILPIRTVVSVAHIVPALILLLAACLIVFTTVIMRRINNSNRNTAEALLMSDLMMEIAARDARITVLVINWKHDGVFACHDGLGLNTATKRIRSILDLEQICGMDNGEMDRVLECMNTLENNQSAEIMVRCFSANHEDRVLRISFHRSGSMDKNFLCSIGDCTHEQAAQSRADDETVNFSIEKNKAASIWQLNVSRNRWRPLHTTRNDPFGACIEKTNYWRDYSSDLSGMMLDQMHPVDYKEFVKEMVVESIVKSFRCGTIEREYEVRIRTASADYVWYRCLVHFWLDPKSSDIFANFYFYNKNAQKNAALERQERKRVLQQSMTAMSGIYSALYYVDLDNDLCYTARSIGGDLADRLSMPYKAAFDAYIDTAVHPEDRDGMRKMLSAYAIKRSMTEGSHFQQYVYRRRIGDGSYGNASITVQPARFENGSLTEIALAIRYNDHDKN